MPGYHRGRAPERTRVCQYPADPPTVRRSSRSCAPPANDATAATRALIVRPLARRAADQRSAQPRRKRSRPVSRQPPRALRKGGKRREVGMDGGRGTPQPRGRVRAPLRVGALLCVIQGPTQGRPWSSDRRARSYANRRDAGVRRRFAPHQLRHAHAVEMAREGVPLNDPATTRALQSRHHQHLPPGNRQLGDHRDRPSRPAPVISATSGLHSAR